MAESMWDDPEFMAICKAAEVAFTEAQKARSKVNRSRREDSLEKAREEMRLAEAEWEKAKTERDRAADIWRARQMQRSARPPMDKGKP